MNFLAPRTRAGILNSGGGIMPGSVEVDTVNAHVIALEPHIVAVEVDTVNAHVIALEPHIVAVEVDTVNVHIIALEI